MKTLHVVLGLGAAVGIGAFLLSQSGGAASCDRVVVTDEVGKRIEAAMPRLVKGLSVDTDALELLRAMFKAGFPGCSFADNANTVIVEPNGREVQWATIVAAVKGKSLLVIANDPDFPALFGSGVGPMLPGKEGASFNPLHTTIEGLRESVSAVLVPFVDPGRPWNGLAEEFHQWKFPNGTTRIGGEGEKPKRLPIVTYVREGMWNADVFKWDSVMVHAMADTEVDAINNVRLAAFYGV